MDHLKDTIQEVIMAVLPITVVVIILQFTVIWLPTEMFIQFLIGVAMVGLGLILFLIGVDIGLLPSVKWSAPHCRDLESQGLWCFLVLS